MLSSHLRPLPSTVAQFDLGHISSTGSVRVLGDLQFGKGCPIDGDTSV